MRLKEIAAYLEKYAPLYLQESYDNSGLSVGDPEMEISRALICIDVTQEVIQEAISGKFDMIISHHPVIFGNLKRLTGKSLTEQVVYGAIKNDIALYSVHTNLDNIISGVNGIIAEKLGLNVVKVLKPKRGVLRKLVTFCPEAHSDKVRTAIFDAGAGVIGKYDSCSYNTDGFGTFRAGEGTRPYVGEVNKLHSEKEFRIETIFPVYLERQVIRALVDSHPYEEVAYDIYPLENEYEMAGSGMIGELPASMTEKNFLLGLKKILNIPVIKHSDVRGKEIKKVAFCGGSGSFLISEAIYSGADIFLTGDIKYHQFFDADGRIVIADIGHFESEQFTRELIYRLLNQKFPNFALQISKVNTNPINYT